MERGFELSSGSVERGGGIKRELSGCVIVIGGVCNCLFVCVGLCYDD